MDIYEQAIKSIIKEQASIIGPLAYDQAGKVGGLEISKNGEVKLKGKGRAVLDDLVNQYSQFFGQVSVEVCKDAIKHMPTSLKEEELPDILK